MKLSGILEFDLGKVSKMWSWKPILERVWWYWHSKACGIVALRPEIEPAPPASEGEVLTTLPLGKSQGNLLKILISGPFPTCKILIPRSQVLLRNLSLLQVPGTGGPNTIFGKQEQWDKDIASSSRPLLVSKLSTKSAFSGMWLAKYMLTLGVSDVPLSSASQSLLCRWIRDFLKPQVLIWQG